jgi:hypothetical protein
VSRSPVDDDAPIEDYLDQLLTELRLPPRATRRLLAEAEDHLLDSTAAAQTRGLSRLAAAQQAVKAFGSPALVAGQARSSRRSRPVLAVAAAWSGAALAAAGLLAVGVSGAFAAVLNAVAGRRFMGALPNSYSAASCHHFVLLHPGPGGCATAAMIETSQDAVALRLAAGIVGIMLAAAVWWTRRYLSTDRDLWCTITVIASLIATACFGAAAAVLVGMAADTAVVHGSGGVGFYASGALAAAIGFALATANLLRFVHPTRLLRRLVTEA